jgi:WD40 repeat protein
MSAAAAGSPPPPPPPAADATVVPDFVCHYVGGANVVVLAPDMTLYVGGSDGMVAVTPYEPNLDPPYHLAGPARSRVTLIKIGGPRGTTYVGYSNGDVWVWQGRECVCVLRGPTLDVLAIEFTKRGTVVVLCGFESRVREWTIADADDDDDWSATWVALEVESDEYVRSVAVNDGDNWIYGVTTNNKLVIWKRASE